MNWIDYSKQKPEVEPKRQLWVKIGVNTYGTRWSYLAFHEDITHWAEIEPPGALNVHMSLEARVSLLETQIHELRSRGVNVGQYTKPPTEEVTIGPGKQPTDWSWATDPFEEWWKDTDSFSDADVLHVGTLTAPERDKFLARRVWDAAVKHTKENP